MTTLTENQKKRTIAHKVSTAKPVLMCPDAVYWPLLDDKYQSKFLELLTRFSEDRTPTKKTSEITTAKSNRSSVFVPEGVRKHLKLGVNSTIRSLEARKAECLLISADISPAFLAKHLVSLALNRNAEIVIAVVADLSSIFKNLFGISCCVCAGEDLPANWRVLLQKATEDYEKPRHFQIKSIPLVASTPEKPSPELPVDFEKVYLRKPSDGRRAFEPPKKTTSQRKDTKNWDEFISFNDDEKMETDEETDKEETDKEETIESTVIQLKDLNLPSLKESVGLLEGKKKKKRKKVKQDKGDVKYVSAVARKFNGNPQKKKKKKNKN